MKKGKIARSNLDQLMQNNAEFNEMIGGLSNTLSSDELGVVFGGRANGCDKCTSTCTSCSTCSFCTACTCMAIAV